LKKQEVVSIYIFFNFLII